MNFYPSQVLLVDRKLLTLGSGPLYCLPVLIASMSSLWLNQNPSTYQVLPPLMDPKGNRVPLIPVFLLHAVCHTLDAGARGAMVE